MQAIGFDHIRRAVSFFAILLLLTAGFIFPAAAQNVENTTKNVSIINVYDAFGKDGKDLTQDFGFS
ncbi:MAG: hypothetical protein ABJA02_13090 [Acidobacteriota bacterium]